MTYLKPLWVDFLPLLVPGDPWLRVSRCLAHEGSHPSGNPNLVYGFLDKFRRTFAARGGERKCHLKGLLAIIDRITFMSHIYCGHGPHLFYAKCRKPDSVCSAAFLASSDSLSTLFLALKALHEPLSIRFSPYWLRRKTSLLKGKYVPWLAKSQGWDSLKWC